MAFPLHYLSFLTTLLEDLLVTAFLQFYTLVLQPWILKTFVLNSTNDNPHSCTKEAQKMAPQYVPIHLSKCHFCVFYACAFLKNFNSFTAISWYLQGNSNYAF